MHTHAHAQLQMKHEGKLEGKNKEVKDILKEGRLFHHSRGMGEVTNLKNNDEKWEVAWRSCPPKNISVCQVKDLRVKCVWIELCVPSCHVFSSLNLKPGGKFKLHSVFPWCSGAVHLPSICLPPEKRGRTRGCGTDSHEMEATLQLTMCVCVCKVNISLCTYVFICAAWQRGSKQLLKLDSIFSSPIWTSTIWPMLFHMRTRLRAYTPACLQPRSAQCNPDFRRTGFAWLIVWEVCFHKHRTKANGRNPTHDGEKSACSKNKFLIWILFFLNFL